MRLVKVFLMIVIASLSVLALPSLIPSASRDNRPAIVSYNPPPANNFHSPLSAAGLIGVAKATPNLQSQSSSSQTTSSGSGSTTIPQNALRFIIDSSYFPQSETTVAIDPSNPSHVVGGVNDLKFFFCGALPSDCAVTPASISGFTTSTDGGASVAKSSDLPNIAPQGQVLVSFGDPSVAASIDGNFFYASLAISPTNFANGIMISKSSGNLFNNGVSCTTSPSHSFTNPCWNAVFVFGNLSSTANTFEDKELIAVDHNPASPFFGSVYISWDHFNADGTTSSYIARCNNDLSSCVMISGGGQPVVSGSDPFPAFATPAVDKSGNLYVTWCNYGTFTTFGPISCRIRSSPPGGTSFGATTTILSFMGSGTTLPTDTVIVGFATEQFRVTSIPSLATDLSSSSNNLYFAIQVCSAGHYYQFSPAVAPVAADNPGNCGVGAILFSKSTNGGSAWSTPVTLSQPAVNDQPYVTVDSTTGQVYVVYYTTQFDQFNHRIDVVASKSNDGGKSFTQLRVTSVSNEPNSDPEMYDYTVASGFGGSFVVPQYGDYLQATARAGTLWVLFTGNYAVEAGTFQADPFLAVLTGQ
ncbi:MAG TPA: sialidase family protein [Candidatus Bathyarchaeia archaeon]|nr:sialidase family protein [Candidatus Bathyarchaeia archaeon]